MLTESFLEEEIFSPIICKKHNAPVKKICTYSEKDKINMCQNRLLCAECELFEHIQDHSSFIEPINELLNGSVCLYLDKLSLKIQHNINLKKEEHSKLIEQVDDIFNDLENHFIKSIRDVKQKLVNKVLTGSTHVPLHPEEVDKIKEMLLTKIINISKTGLETDNPEFNEFLVFHNDIKKRISIAKEFIINSEKEKILDPFVELKVDENFLKEVKKSTTSCWNSLVKNLFVHKSKEINSNSGMVTVGGMTYLEDSSRLFIGDLKGNLNIYDTKSILKLTKSIKVDHGVIKLLQIPKRNIMILGLTEGCIRKFDTTNLLLGPQVKVDLVNISLSYLNSQLIACSGGTKKIELWNFETMSIDSKINTESSVGSTCYIEGKNWLLAGLQNGEIHIINLKNNSIVQKLKAHEQGFWIHALNYQPKYNMITSGSGDGTATIWKFKENKDEFNLLKTIPKCSSWVDIVIPLIDIDILITLNGDKCIRSWKISSGLMISQNEIMDNKSRCAILLEGRDYIAIADNGNGCVKFIHINKLVKGKIVA